MAEPAMRIREGLSGYFQDEIADALDEATYERFTKWMRGQTMAIIQGRSFVYAHDYQRFVRNKGEPDSLAEWD